MASGLWTCPDCGGAFASARQTHTCAALHDLGHHFERREPVVREIFEAFREMVESIGPVIVLPEKTRIAFQVRMSFAQLTPRRSHCDGHVVLARRLEDPRFTKIETLSARNHVHHFRLRAVGEVDATVRAWLVEAYAVGEQRHLQPRR